MFWECWMTSSTFHPLFQHAQDKKFLFHENDSLELVRRNCRMVEAFCLILIGQSKAPLLGFFYINTNFLDDLLSGRQYIRSARLAFGCGWLQDM